MAPGGMSRIAGDTLVIPDRSNDRINWIVATKGFVANKRLPARARSPFGRPIGALRSGSLVLSSAGWLRQQAVGDTVTRPHASIAVLSPAADTATVVANIPDLEVLRLATKYRGRPGFQAVPLRFTRHATAIAWDSVIATGEGDGYRIDLRNERGEIRSSIRVAVRRRLVTKAMRDSTLATALRRFDGPQAERMVDPAESRRVDQITPFADSLPPYGAWFVTPNRTLWVVDYAAPGDVGGAATAFRQDGAILGRLTWSRGGTAVTFGNDRVVLRETDADGVVSLHVFRIVTATR
jgi:hypothetical protein